MFNRAKHFLSAALIAALFPTAPLAQAQILTVLHPFSALQSDTNSDGATPLAGLTQGADGSWYGSTENGGSNGVGTLFKITPQGNFSVVHTLGAFVGYMNPDGAYPSAPMTLGSDGNLYGVMTAGGTNGNYGTVFKIAAHDVLVTLHTFDYSDGENPGAPLVLGRDGNFYGATALGGTNDNGTLFKISTNGDFQTLYEFSFASNSPADIYTNSDGSRPYGLTLGRDGNFYGTTQFGGTHGNGTVFEFTSNGVFNLLHTFSSQDPTNGQNADGASPSGPLVQGRDGGFYGTTPNGGAYAGGTVYRITTTGDFSTLISFNYFTNGVDPGESLILSQGMLYGTVGSIVNGSGAIFETTTNGSWSLLYTFTPTDTNNENMDGSEPGSGVALGRDGNLYGVATYGGPNNTGTVFRLSFPTLTISVADDLTILSWPTNQTDFSLEWTVDLGNSAWTTDTSMPALVGDQWVVTNAVSGVTTFYRLFK